ncbi:hypothetical protein C8R44DRAFT_754196 [Mycena epipterygia]|nr:hypothetical protein C8R44DRAFT_754196 [Mycena epipterygia]
MSPPAALQPFATAGFVAHPRILQIKRCSQSIRVRLLMQFRISVCYNLFRLPVDRVDGQPDYMALRASFLEYMDWYPGDGSYFNYRLPVSLAVFELGIVIQRRHTATASADPSHRLDRILPAFFFDDLVLKTEKSYLRLGAAMGYAALHEYTGWTRSGLHLPKTRERSARDCLLVRPPLAPAEAEADDVLLNLITQEKIRAAKMARSNNVISRRRTKIEEVNERTDLDRDATVEEANIQPAQEHTQFPEQPVLFSSPLASYRSELTCAADVLRGNSDTLNYHIKARAPNAVQLCLLEELKGAIEAVGNLVEKPCISTARPKKTAGERQMSSKLSTSSKRRSDLLGSAMLKSGGGGLYVRGALQKRYNAMKDVASKKAKARPQAQKRIDHVPAAVMIHEQIHVVRIELRYLQITDGKAALKELSDDKFDLQNRLSNVLGYRARFHQALRPRLPPHARAPPPSTSFSYMDENTRSRSCRRRLWMRTSAFRCRNWRVAGADSVL